MPERAASSETVQNAKPRAHIVSMKVIAHETECAVRSCIRTISPACVWESRYGSTYAL